MSIKERLDRLEQLEEWAAEVEKQKRAPKRSFRDKLLGRKSLKKEFKLPRKITTGRKRKVKQNYALVFYIRTNGYIEIDYAPIVNDLVYSKYSGLYHAATADYIMRYKKFPVLIIPEWSVAPIKEGDVVANEQFPFSPVDHANIVKALGTQASQQKVLIDIERKAQLKDKKPIAGKTLLYIIIGVIVVLYLLNSFFNKG